MSKLNQRTHQIQLIMTTISKDDNLAWGCYVQLSFIGFVFQSGILLEIL